MNRIPLHTFEMALHRTSSAPTTLTPDQDTLARQLMEGHGDVRVARESAGLQFYLACPECLQNEGEAELWKMHLAVGVDRYFAGKTYASKCMKCDKVYMIDELTMWIPLAQRGYPNEVHKIVDKLTITEETHEQDAAGNWIPKSPGLTVPLTGLSEDHPVIAYLRSRQFDPAALERHVRAEYCVKERSDLRYSVTSGGFKKTPQGRLILYVYQNGVRVGWQARILEMEDDQHHYYWHPYNEKWTPVETRETPECPWTPMYGYEDFDPAKYLMARGARRNSCLLGYDAAVTFNQGRPHSKKFVMLVEGPLDAVRLGPPAIATLGKVCSEKQAEMLASAFDVVIVVPDNDDAGSKLLEYVARWIGAQRLVVKVPLPKRFKDAGDLSPAEV
ncbi:MAG: toprim domain-containing protein, partial [Verrucomicrobia bacterium]|nr:toprim domain-containing protein [Verrucomicrobiota bacterium]